MNTTGSTTVPTVGSGPSRTCASPLGEAPTSGAVPGAVVLCRWLFLPLLISEERQLAAREQQLQRAQSSHLWHSFRPVDRELRLFRHSSASEPALRTDQLVN